MSWEENINAGHRALLSGLFEQAVQRYNAAISEGRRFAKSDPLWGDAHRGLSRALLALNKYGDAEIAVKIALMTDEKFWGKQSPQVAEDQFIEGEATRAQDKFEIAKSCYERALEFFATNSGEHNDQTMQTLASMVMLYLAMKREMGFAALHARAFAAYQATNPTGNWMRFLRLEQVVTRCFEQGKAEMATDIMNREIAIMSTTLGRNHKELKPILDYHAQVLRDSKKYMAAWRLKTQGSKAQDEGLFFSETRTYNQPPEQVISIISNLLATRGNFMPSNSPRILHRVWWHIKKTDPVGHHLLAHLDLLHEQAHANTGFASFDTIKPGRLELEVHTASDGHSTEATFDWRVHDFNNMSIVREVISFVILECDQTFSILPKGLVRHIAAVEPVQRNWPSPQMYNEAIQNSHLAFSDEQLKFAAPELNAIGLPRPLSGNFATVYKFSNLGKDWAVKCFTEPITDQQQRYACISSLLRELQLPFFTAFEFLPSGINVQGRRFPILKMNWVQGQALNLAIASNLGSRGVLTRMSQAFMNMTHTMELYGIAHGDLQHGNILVINEKLMLVDYDGMFVPELAGRHSNELGHRNYQHPGRTAEHFGTYLDNFSIWTIYAAFFILARHPDLWETLECGDESLLFRQADFTHPDESKTFATLKGHQDPAVREVAGTLLQYLQLTPDAVPPISTFFNRRTSDQSGR